MTRDQLVFILAHMPTFEQAQIAAAFGAGWTPDSVADEFMAGRFPRYVCCDDGTPWAAGGLFPLRDGVWDVWIVTTREARRRRNMETLTAVCRTGIAWAFVHGARAVEAYHLASQHRVHGWLEQVGLKPAQDLPRYGKQGEDFIRFEVTA